MGCHFLLQGIFPIQGSNLGLLHCRQILYQLSYKGSPTLTSAATRSLTLSESALGKERHMRRNQGEVWIVRTACISSSSCCHCQRKSLSPYVFKMSSFHMTKKLSSADKSGLKEERTFLPLVRWIHQGAEPHRFWQLQNAS